MSEPTDPIAQLHRYSIEGNGPSYFRLVEDPAGAWVQWAEVDALRAQRTEGRPPEIPPQSNEPQQCLSVSATGERCELQHFHPFARHQANIAVGNRKPIVEWPVTEWDCSTGRMGLLRQVADLQSQIETLTASIGSVILCAQQDSKVNPQFAGGLQPIIELLQEAQLAAGGRSDATCRQCGQRKSDHCDRDEPGLDHPDTCALMHHEFRGRSEGRATWQPIETAPRNVVCWFWIRPKTAEEAWTDTSGKPINPQFEPYPAATKYGYWSAVSTATHWMPYNLPTAPSASGEDQ